MYLPISGTEISAWLLLAMGFFVGVLAGFFGIGGGFIVTPALNIFGLPMAYAIGTDIAQIMGNSIVATLKHRKMGNVDVKLGGLMFLGTAIGVEMGLESVMYLEEIGAVETVIRYVYIALLGSVGCYMLFDYIRFARQLGQGKEKDIAEKVGSGLSRVIHNIRIPPMISLPTSGIKSISIWAILLVGFLTGFLAGFIGVGGGFIRMPAMIYAIGVPTTIAIGTDLFEIIFSSAVGAFLYAKEGRVEIMAAVVMLFGSAIGAQFGTLATRYVRGMKIRLYFSITIIFAAISVILKQVSVTYEIEILNTAAGYLIMAVAGAMTLVILTNLVKGISEEKKLAPHVERRFQALIASCDSNISFVAVRRACEVMNGVDAKITLVTVDDPKRKVGIEKARRSALGILKEHNREADSILREGTPWKEILKESKNHNFLIIGSHGIKGLTENVLGNNASKIVERTKVTTLVVRGDKKFSKILVNIDLPGYRDHVLKGAVSVAKATGASLEFLHIHSVPTMYPIRVGKFSSDVLKDHYSEKAEELNRIIKAVQEEGIVATGKIKEGFYEEEILLEAEEGGYDLIIVGGSKWSGLLANLLGSLSSHIVKESPVSVLVMKE